MASSGTSVTLGTDHRVYAFRPYQWSTVAPRSPASGPNHPKGRSGHRLLHRQGWLYAFGGYNPETLPNDPDLADDPFWEHFRPLFNELWCFNVSARKWRKVYWPDHDGPVALASHSMAWLEDGLLVFGGTGVPFGLAISNDAYRLDLGTWTWQRLRATTRSEERHDRPAALYGQGTILWDRTFYSIGGTSGMDYFMDVHALDLPTCRWARLHQSQDHQAGAPESRYRHEVCQYQNRLLIFGGGTAFTAFNFETIFAFNLATHAWDVLPTWSDPRASPKFPPPRRCHSCNHWGDDVFVLGGFDGDALFDRPWKLHLPTMQWQQLPYAMPQPVFFHASTVTEHGRAFVFGGVTNIDLNERSDQVTSAWLTIPSLREICWEAVNFYAPNLDTRSKAVLARGGVPPDLMDRLLDAPGA